VRLRWALWIALLLSVGINVGILIAVRRPVPPLPPPVSPGASTVTSPAPRTPAESSVPRAVSDEVLPPVSPGSGERRDEARDDAPRDPAPQPRQGGGSGDHPPPLQPAQPPDDVRVPQPGDRGDDPPPRFDRVADELGLDARQRRPFFELQRRHFESVRRGRAALDDVKAQVARELLSGRADRTRVDALLVEHARRQNELDGLLARLLLESQEILTPEQQRRFAFLVLQRMRRPGPEGRGDGRGALGREPRRLAPAGPRGQRWGQRPP
jgi:hypothetical protein